MAATGGQISFADVVGHPDEANILALVALGIVGGYGDRTFRPDNPVTREQFAKMIVLALGTGPDISGAEELSFADTDQISEWARPYVMAGVGSGLIRGVGANAFAPKIEVTREQALTMIARALVGEEALASMQGGYAGTGFDDDLSIQSWARPAVNYCLQQGIVSTSDYGSLAPGLACTRAMSCRYIARALTVQDGFPLCVSQELPGAGWYQTARENVPLRTEEAAGAAPVMVLKEIGTAIYVKSTFYNDEGNPWGITSEKGYVVYMGNLAPLPAAPYTFPLDVRDDTVGQAGGAEAHNLSYVHVWTYGLEYTRSRGLPPGHVGTRYRAVDMHFDAWIGVPVRAVAAGTVVAVDREGYGQVLMRHTVVPLILYDGSHIYTEWFTQYTHMKGIPEEIGVGKPVEQGATVGLLWNQGCVPYHLHFSITTKLKVTKDKNEDLVYGTSDREEFEDYTISPMWLPGSFRNITPQGSEAGRIACETSEAPEISSSDEADIPPGPPAEPEPVVASPTGAIGSEVAADSWTSGWTTAEFYTIGQETYLFLLKESGGAVHIQQMNTDGTVGERVQTSDWTDGWTVARPFKVGSNPFLFLLKTADGTVHIQELDSDGTVGSRAATYDWSSDWTTAEFYTVGGKTYLFLLKAADGSVHIHRMDSDGTVGTRIQTSNWSSGWTVVRPFTVGTTPFLFLLKTSDGTVHIHELASDGTVDSQTATYDWSSGWTNAEFYTIGGKTYLLLLKRGDGTLKISEMKSDGTVETQVDEQDWTNGWTSVKPFRVDDAQYLFLLKSGDGTVKIFTFE